MYQLLLNDIYNLSTISFLIKLKYNKIYVAQNIFDKKFQTYNKILDFCKKNIKYLIESNKYIHKFDIKCYHLQFYGFIYIISDSLSNEYDYVNSYNLIIKVYNYLGLNPYEKSLFYKNRSKQLISICKLFYKCLESNKNNDYNENIINLYQETPKGVTCWERTKYEIIYYNKCKLKY